MDGVSQRAITQLQLANTFGIVVTLGIVSGVLEAFMAVEL
jgi:hypothetical protein